MRTVTLKDIYVKLHSELQDTRGKEAEEAEETLATLVQVAQEGDRPWVVVECDIAEVKLDRSGLPYRRDHHRSDHLASRDHRSELRCGFTERARRGCSGAGRPNDVSGYCTGLSYIESG